MCTPTPPLPFLMAHQPVFVGAGTKRVYADSEEVGRKIYRLVSEEPQSRIVHYLFGMNGIADVFLPYVEFNMRRNPGYAQALLCTCRLVYRAKGLAFYGRYLASTNRARRERRDYYFGVVLEKINLLGGVLRDSLEKFDANWDEWTLRSVKVRRVEQEAAGDYDWRGQAFLPIKFDMVIGEVFYYDPTYGKMYEQTFRRATRHQMAAILTRSPHLFDMDVHSAGWNRMYDLVSPRITYRGPKHELKMGCDDYKCGVCTRVIEVMDD